jgi:predicted phage terminase large subunit-like protein
MSAQKKAALSVVRRTHLSFFVMRVFETLHPGAPPLRLAWYIKAMTYELGQLRRSNRGRLVITVPRRHLKSITAAVAYVAWLLGHDPTLKIMVASYSQDLARQHSGLTRTIMESEWYKELFPRTRISDRGNRALELETTAGGVRKAVSVGGSVTGFGADIIIIDDCLKADEARSQAVRDELKSWFDNTLMTRLNDKASGTIISICQRLHEDDLPAYLLEKGYDHLNLPAIAEREETIELGDGRVHHRVVGDLLDPDRESHKVLEQLRRDIGPVAFSAQYQQDPVAPEGNLIRMEWLGTYHDTPERHEFLKVVQSWDTASSAQPSSDYSVCTTWGFMRDTSKWYLLDVFRERLDYPDLKRAVIGKRAYWKADRVLIEDASTGRSLFQELRTKGPFLPVLVPVHAGKEERFAGCLGEVEAGHLLLPADAPWLDAFRSELRAFPFSRHDDQVDSFTQFIEYQLKRWRWVLTEKDENGRDRNITREQRRPW